MRIYLDYNLVNVEATKKKAGESTQQDSPAPKKPRPSRKKKRPEGESPSGS